MQLIFSVYSRTLEKAHVKRGVEFSLKNVGYLTFLYEFLGLGTFLSALFCLQMPYQQITYYFLHLH